jgi:hypothetical protein
VILTEIRTRVFEELDWEPSQSTTVKARVDRMINRALEQMVLDAPYLFEEEWLLTTQPDFTPTVTGDTISVNASDPWVFSRDITSYLTAEKWDTDRTWDGRMIKITDSDGVEHFRRIRHVWEVSGPFGIITQYLSIDIPWVDTTSSNLKYHIYTDAYYYGKNFAEVDTVRLHVAGDTTPLEWMTTNEVENYAGRDLPGTYPTSTNPRVAYPLPAMELLTPNTAPRTTDPPGQGSPWAGPRLAGTFQYVYTYVWGLRDEDESRRGPTLSTSSATRRYTPLWESAASPASIETTRTNTGLGITVHMPNIDFDLGFFNGAAAPPRNAKTGIYKRIYVKRTAENTTSPPSGAPNHHDIRDQYYLVAEVSGSTDSYTDNGSDIPDLLTPLRHDTRYQGFGLYPRPSLEIEVKIRGVVQPDKLVSEHDTPNLPGLAIDALVHRVMMMMLNREKNYEGSELARRRYGELMDKCNARYGAGTSASEPVRKRLARAKHGRRSYKPYKRWY